LASFSPRQVGDEMTELPREILVNEQHTHPAATPSAVLPRCRSRSCHHEPARNHGIAPDAKDEPGRGARKAGRVMRCTNGGAIVRQQREVQEPMLMRGIPVQVAWPEGAPPELHQWAWPEKTALFRQVAGNRVISTQENER